MKAGDWARNAFGQLTQVIYQTAPAAKERVARYPNFDILRLLLAVEVAFVHAWATVEPSFNWNPYIMAVPAFLAISGFLVLQSYAESGAWGVFLRKRALRILPALLVSLALCLVLFDLRAAYNSFLNWITGGIYTLPGIANGPLWSLAWEEVAYLVLAGLWVIGAYKRPFTIWALLALSLLICWVTLGIDPHTRMILFLGPAFFIGNLMYLYRDALLKIHPIVPWIFFYIMLQWRFVPDANLMGGAFLLMVQAFAVVWAGMAGARIIPFKLPDLSYGVYIYHMPIILFLFTRFNITTLPSMLLLLAASVIPLCLASWYLVEKPALRLKKKSATINKAYTVAATSQ
ncbi:acyltransferase [Pseudomonas sp. CAN2814]|uniref:acyltransferase family protein n=1 Tax=Pseudomonas sp. CAN1 TaxID=3046726 RepID=UPI00264A3BBE|nr:acyltransferase [Pseudomonas sp. CAN1]MDN6856454.1 acyltransferase [Pseudomonas sp. CAN1]